MNVGSYQTHSINKGFFKGLLPKIMLECLDGDGDCPYIMVIPNISKSQKT